MSYPHIIKRLQAGEEVTLNPVGNSMTPRIKSKQEITISPLDKSGFSVGDVVLARVSGRYFIHLVTAIDGHKVQISNNHGHVNGWTNRSNVYGKVHNV